MRHHIEAYLAPNFADKANNAMIVDFRKSPATTEIQTEICIIGAGPAGLAVAREFFGTSTGVVILESGGLGFEVGSEELNAGESIGLQHAGLTKGRRRQWGGAANIWGAVCVELDASDFERRPWVSVDGWPISAQDVAPFYDRARAMFKLPRTDYNDADWRALGMQTAAFDARSLRYSVAPTTPVPDLGKAYAADFGAAANVQVWLHATVAALKTNRDGTAMDHVEIRSLEGKHGVVRASVFVLCCGGIENARLLLMSRETHASGLGNAYDLVGRYLADHTFSLSARIAPAPGQMLQPFFRIVRRAGSNLRPRLSLPLERQAQAGVLNCMAQVLFKDSADSGFAAAMSLREAVRFRRWPNDLGRDVMNILRHPRELATMAIDRYVRGLHPATATSEPWLQCMSEQAPDPDSRVTLSNRRDRFNLPLPVVDWRASDVERRTIECMTQSVATEFTRLGLGSVAAQPWLTADGTTAWKAQLVEGYHHMGTTRMAASARSGVVNTDGQVFGVSGLYVAGTSLFPAAGYANPTLAIVALAIRLADHLKGQLRAISPAMIAPGTGPANTA